MAFASPRTTPRANGASQKSTPRTSEFITQPNPGTYLWPSETDPNRAHWLRNEVIGFERVIVTLRGERDEDVAALEVTEVAKEKAMAKTAEIQRTVDELESQRDQLAQQNQEQKEIIEAETLLVQEAEEAKGLLIESNKQLASRLAVLDKECLQAKESLTLQQSLQLQLQRHCVDTQTQLEALRNNPAVPQDYSDHVARTEEAHKARIAALQAELRGLLPQEQDVAQKNAELAQKLEELKQEQTLAEESIEEARGMAERENNRRVQMERDLEALQEQYYVTPARVEEREVVREVTVEVQKDIVFT